GPALSAFDRLPRAAYNQRVSHSIDSAHALERTAIGRDRRRLLFPAGSDQTAGFDVRWRARAGVRPTLGGSPTAMIRTPAAHLRAGVWCLLAWLVSLVGATAMAQHARAGLDDSPGQFFVVTEPITSETVARVRAGTRQLVDAHARAEQGKRPILVFEFI